MSGASERRQFGDLATQLVTEVKRQGDNLGKYNDNLVRSVIREQRQLDGLLTAALEAAGPNFDGSAPHALLYQTAIARNKRCLLAYHTFRIDKLKDAYWAAGAALPHILSDASLRARLAPSEVDWLREYNASVVSLRGEYSAELDVAAGVSAPPKDLHVLVRVLRDCGEIQTEAGTIDFKKGQRFMVRRADVEHLVVQGYLQEV
ncbi:GINS complex Psf1 component [Peniophora sp. CONT]|nr:GINS complex Psf1 component [Peniophora sp. CONT]